MGRGTDYSPAEEQLLLDNYDKTIVELEGMLAKQGYTRSRKSINRKLEKMRSENVIGLRSKDTIRRAYKQRSKKPVADNDSGFNKGDGFEGGLSGQGWAGSWDDENK